jgi:MerR family transcriptional regulator/heat shock protein HspR
VNIAGIAIVLQMRERMEEMNRQMQGFVDYVRTEMLARIQQQQPQAGLVPMPRPAIFPQRVVGKAGALKGAVLSGKSAGKAGKGK